MIRKYGSLLLILSWVFLMGDMVQKRQAYFLYLKVGRDYARVQEKLMQAHPALLSNATDTLNLWTHFATMHHCQIIKIRPVGDELEVKQVMIYVQGSYQHLFAWLQAVHDKMPAILMKNIWLYAGQNSGLEMVVHLDENV